jgi:predicted O-methyltransferase YrrM
MAVIGRELFHQVFGDRIKRNSPFTMERDLSVLLSLLNSFRPKRVVEIGVQSGMTARVILEVCPFIESYVGIDVGPDFVTALPFQMREKPRRVGEKALKDSRFRAVVLNGGTKDLVENESLVGQTFPVPVDFVYVDADHSDEGISRDSELARRISHPGGIVAWHDYSPRLPGVVRFIDEQNAERGNHIVSVGGSMMCFEIIR